MKHKSIVRTMVGLVLAVGVAAAGPASAQDAQTPVEVTGTVTSTATGEPVAGATIVVDETGDTVESDAQGQYVLQLAPGQYNLQIFAVGYALSTSTLDVRGGAATSAAIQLEPEVEEIVIIGTLGKERTRLQTPVPIDIISAEEISEASHTETNQVLATVAPSYNATHQTISDGTDHINPASLRGLGPDQVLVLLNGKRRHPSALLNVNGTFGRGTVGVDLNSIPTCAIKRIEVLRDGAASQYGSDAIAGVVNIALKDSVGALEFTSLSGITGEGDGGQLKNCANYGVPVGDDGFINVSGEFLLRDRTQRADPWMGQIFPGVEDSADTNDDNAATDEILDRLGQTRDDYTMRVGQSRAGVGSLYINSKIPLTDALDFYAFGGATHRRGYAAGFYRLPYQEERVDLDIHPNGFLPEINPQLWDWSAAGGVRLDQSGWLGD
ncbi:MAG: TonB-dependent receptor plug domain-containing protein, partial [Myxococcota bacterium]